jgi:hypothetical protein
VPPRLLRYQVRRTAQELSPGGEVVNSKTKIFFSCTYIDDEERNEFY